MELIQNQYDQYTPLAPTEKTWEVSAEVIVPDTQADVYNVLTTSARCQIKQKTLLAEKVCLDGLVEIEALCQEEDPDRWQIVRGSVPFSQEIDLPECTPDATVQLRLEVLRCDALIRNPRKLQLQAQLSAALQLYQKSHFTVSESAGGSEQEDVQLLTRPAELEVLRAVCEKKLVAADEVQVGKQGKLLHYSVDWRQEEQRMLQGKVMLRGSAVLQATFVEEHTLTVQEYAIPFSQVLECEGAEPGDAVTVDYQTMQSQITVLEGDSPALSCNLTGTATACFTRKLQLNVLRDVYSTRYVTDTRQEDVNCPAWTCREQTIPVEELFHPEEPAQTVLDCRARARGFVDDTGKPGGIYTFRLLYCCPEGHLHCAEHTVKVVADKAFPAQKLTVRAGWKDLAARAENGAIRLNFLALLKSRGLQEQPCLQVKSCTLDPNAPRKSQPAGTLVLRAVQPGEDPWSIAKQYGTRVQHILSANKLDQGAALIPGQLMIIPFAE